MGDVFKVEKVLRKRDFNGKTQYLIKWANFPESANTWEPESNVIPFISKQTINKDIEEYRRLSAGLENTDQDESKKEAETKKENANPKRETAKRVKRK